MDIVKRLDSAEFKNDQYNEFKAKKEQFKKETFGKKLIIQAPEPNDLKWENIDADRKK